MVGPEDVLIFWLDEIGPAGWYSSTDELDQKINTRFGATWKRAMDGGLAKWLTYPNGALAYVILLDQFPRNMFRGEGKAFASDKIAIAAAKMAIHHSFDMRIDEPARQFFYLPLMHSENLCDQERCVRMMLSRMPQTGEANLVHAKAHREIIRMFGRFPYRNEALSRNYTTPEREFVANGGYSHTMQELQAVG